MLGIPPSNVTDIEVYPLLDNKPMHSVSFLSYQIYLNILDFGPSILATEKIY